MLDKMKEIICNYVETAPEEITENSRLIEDIGLNSYDFMCMLGDLETEFGVTVDETEVVNLRTVGEAIAYLEKLKD
ncbi:MAG: phosphopantetheine-binding protein [Ruminococcus flavefaciens]|nr:phosphopantetheine-binding protein [Ruminococcus flavefaciens]MCM1361259.1 phosphopantetheine-binding protein [Clostridiales bacterium]MCM1435387.1 phosphopantetheine-binding protein [Ruminococcus flavefaciens]